MMICLVTIIVIVEIFFIICWLVTPTRDVIWIHVGFFLFWFLLCKNDIEALSILSKKGRIEFLQTLLGNST